MHIVQSDHTEKIDNSIGISYTNERDTMRFQKHAQVTLGSMHCLNTTRPH